MEANYRSIDIDELHFDPENPRIPEHIDAADDQAVLDWMLEDAGLVELMGSIAVKGYFPAEPLLVLKMEPDGGYLVMEGNRRLGAVRLLLEPSRAPRRKRAVQAVSDEAVDVDRLQTLPCAVFERRAEVLDYLGFRHITGIKQWEPAAKARYMDTLYKEHVKTAGPNVYRLIARIIGSRADYVSRLLVSLRLYEAILRDAKLQERGVRDEDISFSLITLALNYRDIVEYLELASFQQESSKAINPESLRNLAKWLFQVVSELDRTQLGESRNMKLLATAVAHPEGRAALLRGETAEEAAAASLDIGDLFLRSLRQSRDRLLNAQRLLHRAPVAPASLSILDEIEDLVSQLLLLARRKQRRDDDVNV